MKSLEQDGKGHLSVLTLEGDSRRGDFGVTGVAGVDGADWLSE